MIEQPLVTWLLSTKNTMPYVTRTLQSIAAQTYSHHKLFVWDDCSTDGTHEELQRWVPHRIPGKIFSGRSMRLGPSLAFLVEQADTELCARIDGDDVNLPDRLSKQVAFLSAHPEVGVLGGQIQIIDRSDAITDSWHYQTDDAALRWGVRWESPLCHPAVMFRKDRIIAAGNYRDVKAEDFDLWQRLAPLTEFGNLPDYLIQYRRADTSLTANITDYRPMNRTQAQQNASSLFPGITNPERALELWDSSYPSQHPRPSRFRHIKQLERAAVLLAKETGKPKEYFLNTSLYREQRFRLRRHFFEQIGLMPLVRLRDAVIKSANKQPV